MALGIYGLTQAVLQFVYGPASNRFGRKPVIVAGLLVFAAGSTVAALAPSLLWLTVGRAQQGAGAVSAAVIDLLADQTRDVARTKLMARLGVSMGLTFALSLVLSPVLAAWVGWLPFLRGLRWWLCWGSRRCCGGCRLNRCNITASKPPACWRCCFCSTCCV